jgi:hypothetical protein
MDARQLQAQLIKARETKVTVGRMTFTIRRPTEMELIRMRRPGSDSVEVNLQTLQTHVTGWDGVLESDIVHGGASDPQQFDPELYRQWIEDRRDLWLPLIDAFAKAVEEQDKRIETLRGN